MTGGEWTTEDVRRRIVLWERNAAPSWNRFPAGDKGGDAFDRWIAAHDAEVKAAGWDEGAEFMDSDAFHFDGGSEMNPYRYIRLTAGGEVPYDEVPSDELPGMWERSDFV